MTCIRLTASLGHWPLWLVIIVAIISHVKSTCTRLPPRKVQSVTLTNDSLRVVTVGPEYRLPLSAIAKKSVNLMNTTQVEHDFNGRTSSKSLLSDPTAKQQLKLVNVNESVATIFWHSIENTWSRPYYASLSKSADSVQFTVNELVDAESLVSDLPVFGFIYQGVVHLWDVHQRKVFLFQFFVPKNKSSKVPVTALSFEHYFRCSKVDDEAMETESKHSRTPGKHNAIPKDHPVDFLYLVLVIGAIILVSAFLFLVITSFVLHNKRASQKQKGKVLSGEKKHSKYIDTMERSDSAISTSDPPKSPRSPFKGYKISDGSLATSKSSPSI